MIKVAVATSVSFLFLVSFPLVLLMAVQRVRGSRRRQKMSDLGFHPVEEPNPLFYTHILKLHGRGADQVPRVDNVFTRASKDCRLFFFDLWDDSENGGQDLLEGGLAVVSSRLRLPLFSLRPNVSQDAANPAADDSPFDGAARRKGAGIAFPSCPAFERRYTVSGENEVEIRRFFTDARLQQLSKTQEWLVEASDNMFTFDELRADQGVKKAEAVEAGEKLDNCLTAFEILSSN